MSKQKKCHGTGKAKGFGCNNLAEYRKYGLGINCCWAKWLLTTKEGKSTMAKNSLRNKKTMVKEKKTMAKKIKIENKSIQGLVLEARQPYQKLIRIRDHRKPCISCERMLPFELGSYHAGHYFKAELYSGLIFHPINANGQCVQCNTFYSGNESGYFNGLIKRVGYEQYNQLLSVKDSLKSYKWDRYKLIEMKKHYASELKEVEKGIKSIDEVDFSIGIV